METLFKKHQILISQVSMDIVRETIHTISWEKQLVGIRGSRGVGKTTLMRQYIKKNYGIKLVYILAVIPYFSWLRIST